MKLLRLLTLLEILTLGLVTGIFIWQLFNLPGMQTQISTGLHTSLQSIAREAAIDLDRKFTEDVLKLSRPVTSSAPLSEENLGRYQNEFARLKSKEPLASVYLIAFPDTLRPSMPVYEFIPPGRFHPKKEYGGNWRTNTDLSQFVQKEMDSLVSSQGGMKGFLTRYLQNRADSSILLTYNKTFSPTLIVGTLVRQGKTVGAIVFAMINQQHFEQRFVQDFFNNEFQPETSVKAGIDLSYLRFGVFSSKGNQVIYNSVAFGSREFEHVFALDDIGSKLSGIKIGVSFRNGSVDEVAARIYNRNYYLFIGLFVALLLLLMVAFRSARRLVRLTQLKSEFVANVSHEIKTPLASIRLAADTLRLGRAQNPEQQEGLVRILMRESERLDYLVHTLLDFSQMEAGKKNYRKETMQAPEWQRAATQFFRERAGTMAGTISGSAGDAHLSLDRLALEQVINILTDNAIKYSGNDPRVDLLFDHTEKESSFSIRDFGIGIKKEDQKIIFEKFVRIGNTDVHDVKGHGIGLSIARAIVRGHGGRITVVSEPGKGSTFTVHLPVTHLVSPV